MDEDRQIKLYTLNPCITCKICKGYLISATTVIECLHTFCKTCLVKHLEENNTCPECNIVIHQSHPLCYIKFDRTLQDLVYKLVPGLMENEQQRERAFYKARGLPFPKDIVNVKQEEEPSSSVNPAHEESDYHRLDEQVHLHLIPGPGMKSLPKSFIRCSAHATIHHAKLYLSRKLFDNCTEHIDELQILCNDQPQAKDHTLKFVYVTKWRFKDPPMILRYQKIGLAAK